MSLILEALKKSEAERRLGQMPGLMTPVQPTVRRRRSKLPLLLGAVALLGVAGGIGWWWLRPLPVAGDVASVSVDESRVAPGVAPPATPTPTPTPAQSSAPTAPPTVSTPRIAPPPAELPSDPDFVSTERESRPVTPDTPPPREPAPARPVTREVAAAPSSATSPAPVAKPAIMPTIEPATDPTDSPEPAAPPAPLPVPATLPTPALEALPRIGELSAAERESLPPLKLSMHVYAAEPAARFVLIDGQRLVEGARIANGLTLSEIRRDGAVVEFDGRRFLVPRL